MPIYNVLLSSCQSIWFITCNWMYDEALINCINKYCIESHCTFQIRFLCTFNAEDVKDYILTWRGANPRKIVTSKQSIRFSPVVECVGRRTFLRNIK